MKPGILKHRLIPLIYLVEVQSIDNRLHLKLDILKLGKEISLHRLIPLIYCFSEDYSYLLEKIRQFLGLHLKLEMLKLFDHIIVHEFIPLM